MNSIEYQAKNLRKFHNYVKFKLLENYCDCNSTVLDIGCGRGGDMHKWQRLGIKKVVGIDINKNYVFDAMRRYKNMKTENSEIDYSFYFTTQRHIFIEFLKFKNLQLIYNSISCMFAFHYFFENESSINKIFEQISSSLEKDGYFFGTVMDGNTVSKLIENTEIYNTNAMFLKKEYNEKKYTGSKISFMLSGTLYFGEKTLSTEYLVLEEALKYYGKKYNLNLVEYKCFKDYMNDDFDLNSDFSEASFLNYTFAFKKEIT